MYKFSSYERVEFNSHKPKQFALRIIKLYKYLCEQKKEYILSKQIVRSGTSIGANAKEASVAQSKADFYAKLSISLKEAAENRILVRDSSRK